MQTEPLISKAKHILKSRSFVHSRVGFGVVGLRVVGLPVGLPVVGEGVMGREVGLLVGLPVVGEGVMGRGVGCRVGLDVGCTGKLKTN